MERAGRTRLDGVSWKCKQGFKVGRLELQRNFKLPWSVGCAVENTMGNGDLESKAAVEVRLTW